MFGKGIKRNVKNQFYLLATLVMSRPETHVPLVTRVLGFLMGHVGDDRDTLHLQPHNLRPQAVTQDLTTVGI